MKLKCWDPPALGALQDPGNSWCCAPVIMYLCKICGMVDGPRKAAVCSQRDPLCRCPCPVGAGGAFVGMAGPSWGKGGASLSLSLVGCVLGAHFPGGRASYAGGGPDSREVFHLL